MYFLTFLLKWKLIIMSLKKVLFVFSRLFSRRCFFIYMHHSWKQAKIINSIQLVWVYPKNPITDFQTEDLKVFCKETLILSENFFQNPHVLQHLRGWIALVTLWVHLQKNIRGISSTAIGKKIPAPYAVIFLVILKKDSFLIAIFHL